MGFLSWNRKKRWRALVLFGCASIPWAAHHYKLGAECSCTCSAPHHDTEVPAAPVPVPTTTHHIIEPSGGSTGETIILSSKRREPALPVNEQGYLTGLGAPPLIRQPVVRVPMGVPYGVRPQEPLWDETAFEPWAARLPQTGTVVTTSLEGIPLHPVMGARDVGRRIEGTTAVQMGQVLPAGGTGSVFSSPPTSGGFP